jgi:hypothetical protein
MRLFSCTLWLMLVCLAGPARAAPDLAEGWRSIKKSDGIEVWQRASSSTGGFSFRGEGVVNGSVLRVAAIVTDASRYTEWAKNCVGSFDIERIAPGHTISYRRFTSGAPMVSDRDMVLDTQMSLDTNSKSFMLAFKKDHDSRKAPPSGVVRVSGIEGFYQLKQLDAEHTYVTYQVKMDPGGSIPGWVANQVSRDTPLATLVGLRLQAEKTGYEASERRLRAAFHWEGFKGMAVGDDGDLPAAPSGGPPLQATPGAP